MHSRLGGFSWWAGCVLALSVLSCGHAPSRPKRETPERGSRKNEAPPVPEFLLSGGAYPLADDEDPVLFRGWPLTLNVFLAPPGFKPSPTPIRVEARSGGWHSLIKLAVYPAEQAQAEPPPEPLPWPLRLASEPSSPVALDTQQGGRLVLVLDARQTAELEPGRYEVMAWLDTRSGATEDSYQGVLRSSLTLSVQDPPKSLSDELACVKAQEEVEYAQAHRDPAGAAAALDDFLRRFPQSKQDECWGLRARFFEEAGKHQEAVKYYEQATAVFRESHPEALSHSPYEAQCQALLTKLLGPPKGRTRHACVWPL